MKTLNLDGIWQCKGASGPRGGIHADWPRPQPFMPTFDMKVPGTVQEALEWITGDVHLSHNVLKARFIEEQYWLVSRTFTITKEDLTDGNRVRVVFEGLALCAYIYVNEKLVGRHNNFYTPCRIDITDAVFAGENRIDVRLDSGILEYTDKDCRPTLPQGGKAPDHLLHRVYARQPQSQYEWDWSPRLLNVGIFKPCYLQIAPVFLDEASVFHDLNDDYSLASVRVRQFLNVPAERTLTLEARIDETGEGAEIDGTVSGQACLSLSFRMEHPRLWYPRNHGTPYRYTLRLTVRDTASGEVLGEVVKKIGLRRVEIDQSPRPAGGRYFTLLVNGVRLFAKGGNMIPADIIFSRLTRDTYRVLIDRALEDNFNALRVWGGGIYESDDFYDLCDEHGIVVWQDFIGACATYPAFDKEFVDNYIAEITYQIRRLSSYASLVIYAGNNEIDQFLASDARLNLYTDASLYYVVLPRVLRREGDNHYYQPSSPFSPDGINPTSDTVGDQHPWGVTFGSPDYFQYRTYESRFPNEGGVLGPTSLPNMMAALGKKQNFMYSYDFKVHDNSLCDSNRYLPEIIMEQKLGITSDRERPLSIPDYVYYGGLVQNEALTEYILNFRRRMNDTTGSAIFWMYNDCWPATRSWTTVDYLRNRTPAFWGVKRAFAPIAVDIVRTKEGFDIYGINEYLEPREATLTFGSATANGAEQEVEELTVTLPANNSGVIARLPYAEDRIPFAELAVEGEPLARRRYIDRRADELGLGSTEIRVSVDKKAGTATYVADAFVFGVCLDLDGTDGKLSDNFFDLFPGRPYTVRLGRRSGRVLCSYMGQSGDRDVLPTVSL